MTSIKIMVIDAEDKNTDFKNDIWFGSKRHQADGFTELSQNTLCVVRFHWGHITLQWPDMETPRCNLCAGPQTAKNYSCKVNLYRGRASRVYIHTTVKCANC